MDAVCDAVRAVARQHLDRDGAVVLLVDAAVAVRDRRAPLRQRNNPLLPYASVSGVRALSRAHMNALAGCVQQACGRARTYLGVADGGLFVAASAWCPHPHPAPHVLDAAVPAHAPPEHRAWIKRVMSVIVCTMDVQDLPEASYTESRLVVQLGVGLVACVDDLLAVADTENCEIFVRFEHSVDVAHRPLAVVSVRKRADDAHF